MRRTFIVGSTLLAASLFTAGDLAAQASRTEGFLLGARVNGTALNVDDETDSGAGLGFIVGYGFSPAITLYLNFDGASLDGDGGSYDFGQVDLGLRYTFGTNAAALRPYVNGALTGSIARFTEAGETLDLRGGGLTVGGGLNYFFTQRVALSAAAQLTFGQFTELAFDGGTVDLDENESFTASRFQLGVSFRP
jgi:hypothetical protein